MEEEGGGTGNPGPQPEGEGKEKEKEKEGEKENEKKEEEKNEEKPEGKKEEEKLEGGKEGENILEARPEETKNKEDKNEDDNKGKEAIVEEVTNATMDSEITTPAAVKPEEKEKEKPDEAKEAKPQDEKPTAPVTNVKPDDAASRTEELEVENEEQPPAPYLAPPHIDEPVEAPAEAEEKQEPGRRPARFAAAVSDRDTEDAHEVPPGTTLVPSERYPAQGQQGSNIPKDPDDHHDQDTKEKNGPCEDMAQMVAYPISQNDPPENLERGNWSNPVEFILSCLGYAIGLGNVWRFPYVVYKYGGGSFMFAYFIIFILVAFPTFFLELSLGQFNSRGPLHIFRNMIPAFEGLGWASLLVQFNSAIYYNGIHAWAIFYMFSSFTADWKHCESDWNSPQCFTIDDYSDCIGTRALDERWYVKGKCYHDTNVSLLIDHLDKCYRETLHSMDRLKDPKKRYHDCSVAFMLDFGPNLTAREFILGLGHTQGLEETRICEPSLDICLFQSENVATCEQLSMQKRKIKEIKGPQLMDFRFRDNVPADEVTTRRDLLKKKLDAGRHASLKTILELYCERNFGKTGRSYLGCLRKILRPDESFSSEEYYRNSINHEDSSFSNLMGFHWPLPFCLIFAWIIVGFGTWGGPKWIGKIVYFTSLFPCFMIIVLVIISVTMEGHSDGISFYLQTRWCELANPLLWLTATGQIFFSLSIGGGGLMTLASFNRFHNDIARDSLIVALGNCIFSFISGFGVFGVIGCMAKMVGADVGEVLRGSSEGIAFVTYAQATSGFAGGEVVAFLFFFMLVLLAVDSEFAMVETILTALYDEFPILNRNKIITMLVFCLVFFLLCLPHVTKGGSHMVGTIDAATYDFLVPLCCIGELIVIIFFYGFRNFVEDIKMMAGVSSGKTKKLEDGEPKENAELLMAQQQNQEGMEGGEKAEETPPKEGGFHLGHFIWSSYVRYYFVAAWLVFVPVGVSFLFIAVVITSYLMEPNDMEGMQAFVFWSIAGIAFPVLLVIGYLWNRYYRNKTITECFTPTEEYGPPLNENRTGRYRKFPEKLKKRKKRITTVI